jgi:hypothetical protein
MTPPDYTHLADNTLQPLPAKKRKQPRVRPVRVQSKSKNQRKAERRLRAA